MVDPTSILLGVPVLGPVVVWLFLELKELRKWMQHIYERVVHDETLAKLELARALTQLQETLTHRMAIERELLDVLRRR